MARFDGGTISSDGGAFLLRQTDKRLNLLPRLAECFLDGRNQALVEHSIAEMLSQRVYGLALGYEDLNDHEQLRKDPVFGILAGKEDLAEPLAGKSTLNRMELGTGINDRYKKITFWKEAVDELLVNVFIESHQKRSRRDRAGHGHHRPAVARQTGRALLSRLLRQLLLSAAVRLLRRSRSVRAVARSQSRRRFRLSAGDSSASWSRFGRRGRK